MPTQPVRREAILHTLRTAPDPCSIAEIARELAIHPNTVRFHLDGLLRAGRVEQVASTSTGPGRPPILFRPARRMDPAGPTNYRLLAGILTDHLARDPDVAEIATQLGRASSPALVASAGRGRAPSRTRAVTELVAILGELGFAPEPVTTPRAREIRLRHCPFQNLAENNSEVICSVHLGLMQGALTTMRAPVTVDRLDSFVEPDLCVAHLTAATATSGEAS